MTSPKLVGKYKVYQNGVLVAEQPNLITTNGKSIILRYLAGSLSAWAGGIGVGAGDTAPAVTDTRLQFEFERLHVDVKAANMDNNSILIKAAMPQNSSGVVYELGLYPYAQPGGTDSPGHLILDFNPNFNELQGGTLSANSRIGGAGYSVTAPASTTSVITAPFIRSDFSGYGDQDTFTLAASATTANTSSIRTRMMVDGSNYFEYTAAVGATTGYRTLDWQKSQFVAVGTPSWESITSAEFAVTATAGGSATVDFDGLRVSDTDIYPDFALISRTVLVQPISKAPGESMDIEYSMGFNI